MGERERRKIRFRSAQLSTPLSTWPYPNPKQSKSLIPEDVVVLGGALVSRSVIIIFGLLDRIVQQLPSAEVLFRTLLRLRARKGVFIVVVIGHDDGGALGRQRSLAPGGRLLAFGLGARLLALDQLGKLALVQEGYYGLEVVAQLGLVAQQAPLEPAGVRARVVHHLGEDRHDVLRRELAEGVLGFQLGRLALRRGEALDIILVVRALLVVERVLVVGRLVERLPSLLGERPFGTIEDSDELVGQAWVDFLDQASQAPIPLGVRRLLDERLQGPVQAGHVAETPGSRQAEVVVEGSRRQGVDEVHVELLPQDDEPVSHHVGHGQLLQHGFLERPLLPHEVDLAAPDGVARQLILDGVAVLVRLLELAAMHGIDQELDGRRARVRRRAFGLQDLDAVGDRGELADLEQDVAELGGRNGIQIAALRELARLVEIAQRVEHILPQRRHLFVDDFLQFLVAAGVQEGLRRLGQDALIDMSVELSAYLVEQPTVCSRVLPELLEDLQVEVVFESQNDRRRVRLCGELSEKVRYHGGKLVAIVLRGFFIIWSRYPSQSGLRVASHHGRR